MILKLVGETVNLERLIYVKPQSIIDFKISTDKAAYSPGDEVSLTISSEFPNPLYASIKITDVSSLLKVPRYKHQPSLPSMVFLEKEILDSPEEFLYSDEYIDYQFESKSSEGFLDRKTNDYYLLYTDILLGIQTWRRGMLDDVQNLESIAREMEDEEKLKYEYLMGKKVEMY
jgi:hypothetical protein